MMARDRAAEDLARLFHETYERLAPDFGYRTREASAKPWEEVPEQNRALMVATAGHVLDVLECDDEADRSPLVDPLLEAAWGVIANAGEGSWDRESADWREAATRWRDRYHERLAAVPRVPPGAGALGGTGAALSPPGRGR